MGQPKSFDPRDCNFSTGTGAKHGPAPFAPGAVYWDHDLSSGAQC